MDIDHSSRQIRRNVAIHDRIARRYDKRHGEIFNDIEQARLRQALKLARDSIGTAGPDISALDFGCGSGNLTKHLLDLGLMVTAADISQGFLDLVRSRYPGDRLETRLMPNGSVADFPDSSFDMIATYSVLHHIPDYLAALAEMTRLCRVGGVIFLDHEPCESYWSSDNSSYEAFRSQALRFDWRKYLTPSNYLHRIRRIFNPRHANEGDIHVWPDDHVEWPKIKLFMKNEGFEIVAEHDYLLNRKLYRPEVFERFQNKLMDTKMMIFRKCGREG